MINHPIVSVDFGRDRAGVTVTEIGDQPKPIDPSARPKLSIQNAPSVMETPALWQEYMRGK